MIALLVVSHSPLVAQGIAEIAAQMGGHAEAIVAVGGTETGELGSSLVPVMEKLKMLLTSYQGVVLVPDMGSSVLTSVAAFEMLEPEEKARVAIADAPILEGTVLAAVEAGGGSSLQAVLKSAQEAYHIRKID